MLLVLGAGAPARAEAIDDSTEREARAYYEQATRLYNVGELDRAIAAFKRAYELSPAAGLLFNIAQAYRAKYDVQQALYFYDAFLREDPDAPERSFVEARIAELRAMPPDPPPVVDRSKGLRTAGAVTTGIGAAMIVTGLVFAVQAYGAFGDVAAGGDPADGKAIETRAILFTGAGMIAMVTGCAMFYVGSRPVQVQPVIAPGTAAVQVTARF